MASNHNRDINRFRSTALTAWVLVGSLLTLTLLVTHPTFLPTQDPEQERLTRPRADFMVFYASGLLVAESPGNLYNPVRQAAAQRAATGLDIYSDDLDFNAFGYPPVVALLFVPFTLFDYTTAYFLMMLTNLLLLGFGLWLLSRRLSLGRGENKVLVLSATILFPVYATLIQGQVSLLMFLIFILIITNLRSGHTERAGVWTGFLAIKPTLLPVVFCWFLFRRHWKALVYAAGVSSLLAVGSMVLIGTNGVTAYIDLSQTLFSGATFLSQPLDTFNLRALTNFAGLGDVAWLAGAGLIVGLIWLRERDHPARDWEYCALILGTILAARHVLVHSLTVTLIVVALVLAQHAWHVSARFRWFLFLLMMAPAVYTATMAGPRGLHWPFIPALMTALFLYFIVARPPSAADADGQTLN